VLRLDPRSLAVEAEIPLAKPGFGLALDDAAGRLYVGNALDASITVIDIGSGKTVGTIRLAEKIVNDKGEQVYPHHFRELVLDPEHHRLFAPGLGFKDSALYVVDTRTMALEMVLPGFGFAASGAALDGAHGRLFVSNVQGQVFTVDSGSLEVLASEPGL
jgi:DNA-binding beta-propeller fold protein YncE